MPQQDHTERGNTLITQDLKYIFFLKGSEIIKILTLVLFTLSSPTAASGNHSCERQWTLKQS